MSKTLIFVEAAFDEIVVGKIIEKLGKNLLDNTFAIALGESNITSSGQLRSALLKNWKKIFKDGITKIARICDIDNNSISDLEFSVNTAIQTAFNLPILPTLKENNPQIISIPPPDDLKTFSPRPVEFICYFVGKKDAIGNKTGELEDLLRLIAKQPANISDCVDTHLPNCLTNKGVNLKNVKKSLSKLWLYNYQRFDAGDVEYTAFNETTIEQNFNDMFNLNADVPELKELINCIKNIAQ